MRWLLMRVKSSVPHPTINDDIYMRQSNGLVNGNIQFTSDVMIFGSTLDEEPSSVANVCASKFNQALTSRLTRGSKRQTATNRNRKYVR